jgi:hypothetical protein
MLTSARLPGIQFDVVAPPTTEGFVRMDIAVFVGFTASGPLHQPVAVESIAHFEEIFGNDAVIGNSDEPGTPLNAYLPSALRAFFRNGGSRCWVIRVAGPYAISNAFPVPGVYELRGDATVVQAYAVARSEGSWSDLVAVGSALRSQPIEVTGFASDTPSATLLLSSVDDVVAGDLLRFTFGDSHDVLWFFVDAVTPVTTSSPVSSRRLGRLVVANGQNMLWQPLSSPLTSRCKNDVQPFLIPAVPADVAMRASEIPPVCERLTMDITARRDAQSWSMTNLGFGPSHPRYWAALPTDAILYGSDSPEQLAVEATHPRFPLAGKGRTQYFLPLCVGPLPLDVQGPDLTKSVDPLTRDGLSVFERSLFLDPALADCSMIDLLREADYIQYQIRYPAGQQRKLKGIHAALAIEEATIIAAPDAVHRGWKPAQTTALASPPDSAPLPHPEWWHFLDCQQKQDIPRVANPPAGQFEPCELSIVTAPFLQLSNGEGGGFSLTWTPLLAEVDYVDSLEEAVDPAFVTAAVVYAGRSGSFTIYSRPPGDYYYRVRRQIGTVSSNYSNGVGKRIDSSTAWKENPVEEYQDDTLLTVHRALLRLCAARGDMFAVLAMPRHYREAQATAHATELKAAFEAGERISDSFGALYHPWLIGREENDLVNLRTNPPDGAMAGILALRSSERGPWISPANEPLHGAVDLVPFVARASRQTIQDSLINLIRQEPGGFLCLCALTLSDDPDLSPINVRRLLSFLRKTALRAGVDYVFEPNGDEFRRGVQRGFENLLDGLLARGAFAGRTARESFQVVIDASLNTREAMDNGQFFVELRVAPSLPLRFLTIRLLQTADRTFVTEGG